MHKLLMAGAVIALSLVLGATVFREQIAWAAQTVDARITNLDNSGNIKVHEQGTARVEIQGSPQVSLGDSEQHPLWVRDVDAPTRPFQLQFTFAGGTTHQTVDVPAGETLVIEYVDANAVIFDPGAASGIGITTVAGGHSAAHFIAFEKTTTAQGYALAQEVRIYADPGSEVDISYPFSSDISDGVVNLSGHFVPTG